MTLGGPGPTLSSLYCLHTWVLLSPLPSSLHHLTTVLNSQSLPSVSSVMAASCPSIPYPCHRDYVHSVLVAPCSLHMLLTPSLSHSTAPQRVPVASPSAHNISSSSGAPDRTNFPRGVSSRSTFHAGQLRQVRDQQNLPYGVTPASPSGHSQGRRGASGSIFSKFTSKFVRR